MAEKLNVLSICWRLRMGSCNAIEERVIPALALERMSFTPAPPYRDLPIYNFAIQHEQGIPADVTTLVKAILTADGVVIVSAEYNYSIPSGLKNAIDWLSRMKEPSPFTGKSFAIQSATSGSVG